MKIKLSKQNKNNKYYVICKEKKKKIEKLY